MRKKALFIDGGLFANCLTLACHGKGASDSQASVKLNQGLESVEKNRDQCQSPHWDQINWFWLDYDEGSLSNKSNDALECLWWNTKKNLKNHSKFQQSHPKSRLTFFVSWLIGARFEEKIDLFFFGFYNRLLLSSPFLIGNNSLESPLAIEINYEKRAFYGYSSSLNCSVAVQTSLPSIKSASV